LSSDASRRHIVVCAVLHILCSDLLRTLHAADAQLGELAALADEKGSLFWKAQGMSLRGSALASTSDAAEAVHVNTTEITEYLSTGATDNQRNV
jgi:hypothetical protein